MDAKEISRQEYIARINRVMDYISQNIDSYIDLSKMANLASFSPYHFHRIFTFIVGETPNNFLLRIRLEKAAQFLQDNPKSSITEIAFSCGYENVSSFSRSFKNYFGVSAKHFRQIDKAIYVKNDIRYSKNGIAISKNSKNIQHLSYQFCSVELNKIIIMDTKIEIKQMPELNLVYCRHTGSFNQIGKAYEKLYKWATPRELINDNTKMVTVYLDDPAITSINKVRQDASIITKGNVKVDGEIGKSTLKAGKYAVGNFEINETQFEEAWNTMYAWLSESGYQPANSSPYELYHKKEKTNTSYIFNLDICIPIKSL